MCWSSARQLDKRCQERCRGEVHAGCKLYWVQCKVTWRVPWPVAHAQQEEGGTYNPKPIKGDISMEALQVLQPPLVCVLVGEVWEGSEAGPHLREGQRVMQSEASPAIGTKELSTSEESCPPAPTPAQFPSTC